MYRGDSGEDEPASFVRRGQTFGAVWRYPVNAEWCGASATAMPQGAGPLTLRPELEWNVTRAEAELKPRQVDVERSGFTRPDVVRLGEFTAEWLEDYLPARSPKPTTVASSSEGAVRSHLVPALGHITLTKSKRHTELIDRFVARKLREGLPPKTVTNHLLVLQLVCKRAVRPRLMTRNPGDGRGASAARTP
jgi:hypothetical protein